MSKSPTAEMIVLHFCYQFRGEGFPLSAALRAPPARPARPVTRKARLLDELLELLRKRRLFFRFDVRREADMVQQTFVVVQAEQERTDQPLLGAVAKAADDTFCGAHALEF